MTVCEFLGFLLGATLVGAFWVAGFLGQQIWLVALVALPTLLIGTLIPRAVFRNLLSASCPEADCDGHAFAQDTRPIAYICKRCSKKFETNLSDGEGGIWHRH